MVDELKKNDNCNSRQNGTKKSSGNIYLGLYLLLSVNVRRVRRLLSLFVIVLIFLPDIRDRARFYYCLLTNVSNKKVCS